MTINEIQAKSILRKHKKIDSWFVSQYGMNLYRGCTHNCAYCDGRNENYHVDGAFGEDVTVKINAPDILRKELDPKRKRKPFKKSFIIAGGGVCDGYQPIERKYRLTRQSLELIKAFHHPVHVLTKSTLVKRDTDILKDINRQNRAVVSLSFSSSDDAVSARFEPGVPPPSERLETIAFLKNEGIACGMFLMPVIPFITDTPAMMETTVRKAKEAGVDFIVFAGMTLKQGRQKQHFYRVLEDYQPGLIPYYEKIYPMSKWGEASRDHYNAISQTFARIARKYGMAVRIPPRFFNDMLDENDRVTVMLEHIDYFLKLNGQTSPYGYAAWSISQLKHPLSEMKETLTTLKGVGPVTADLIREILDTGESSYYRKLSGNA